MSKFNIILLENQIEKLCRPSKNLDSVIINTINKYTDTFKSRNLEKEILFLKNDHGHKRYFRINLKYKKIKLQTFNYVKLEGVAKKFFSEIPYQNFLEEILFELI